MDFHLLVVIACVFLGSLLSLVVINKIFRRKTFEEVIAEKKALSANLYAQSKAATNKKPRKKELKREKKQRQKDHQQRDVVNTEQEDSDALSEQLSVEDEPQHLLGLSKSHVEFEPDPMVLIYNTTTEKKRNFSNSEKENMNVVSASNQKIKNKKDKKNGIASKSSSGILINKNEAVTITPHVNTADGVNNFNLKTPKDAFELKRQEKEREKQQQQSNGYNNNVNVKKEKNFKKEKLNVNEKTAALIAAAVEQAGEMPHIAKEILKQQQQQEDKVRQGSPKTQHNATNNKTKQQQKKQQQKDALSTTKELVQALDKLSENETVGVSLFMNLFRRAELNRSEIQILIDYLLNKQQDMPSSHSEWSDDICQKLKRQLEEKEKALAEEQEASVGIQAKLRELRTEINTERAQMNVTIKAYIDKLHGKEQELANLNQEVQQLNDKLALERQQFQTKLLREKQAGSQDLVAQLTLMQNELGHKDKCIAELTAFMNASHQAVEESQQKNEIIQQQLQQLRALEQQRDELETLQNNSIFELEKLKTLETENSEIRVEVRNLQNALESSKVDLSQTLKELEAYKNELTIVRNNELSEKHKEIIALQSKNSELLHEIKGANNKAREQSKEHTSMQVALDALQKKCAVKEEQLADVTEKHSILQLQLDSTKQQITQQENQLQKEVETLKADVANKHAQLLHATQAPQAKEKELLQQLIEQREKNNDLRMKNWKLVESLQNAETTQKLNTKHTLTNQNANVVLLSSQQTTSTNSNSISNSSAKDEKHLRELFQRLYPDAVKACASSALSTSLDQWVEQVLATLVRQTLNNMAPDAATITPSNNGSNKYTEPSNSSNNNKHNTTHHSNSNSTSSTSDINRNDGVRTGADAANLQEQQELFAQNSKLRRRIDELTQLVTKTSNTLLDLETRAREQDEHWRSIVRKKDDIINTLQHSNGEQGI